MQILDMTCSGRRLCELAASDPRLLKTEPCQAEFANYLAAKYRCQPGKSYDNTLYYSFI